jgi:hypothetical protein
VFQSVKTFTELLVTVLGFNVPCVVISVSEEPAVTILNNGNDADGDNQ